jgi:hypothetical protein
MTKMAGKAASLRGGKPMALFAWFAGLIILAGAFSAAESWMLEGRGFDITPAEWFTGALVKFGVSGVIPLAWWGVRGFRRTAAGAPLALWAVLLVLLGWSSLAAISFLD